MDVIRKLELTVGFGGNRFQVGQGEWEAMTFNDKHRWVFPLAPNACAYTKSEQYFRKCKPEILRFCKHKEISWKVRMYEKLRNRNKQIEKSNGEFYKISHRFGRFDTKFTFGSSPSDFGGERRNHYVGKIKRSRKIFDLEEHLNDIQKEKENLENRKEVVDKEEENSVEN